MLSEKQNQSSEFEIIIIDHENAFTTELPLNGFINKKNEILQGHSKEKSCIRKVSFMFCHRDNLQIAFEKPERETGKKDLIFKIVQV